MNAAVELNPTEQVGYMRIDHHRGSDWRSFYEHLLAHKVYDLKTKPEHSFLHRMYKLGMEQNRPVFDCHYVAFERGAFRAIATVNKYKGKTYINVYVHPDYQRRSIARDFLAMLREEHPTLHGVYTTEGAHLYHTQGVIEVNIDWAVAVWETTRDWKGS